MKKYQIEFKLAVVKSFLTGAGRAKLLARRRSVPEEKIRTLVSHYNLHGIDGLRPKRSAYSAKSSCRSCLTRTVNSFRAAKWRRSMTSVILTRWWSGDANSMKAACRCSGRGSQGELR